MAPSDPRARPAVRRYLALVGCATLILWVLGDPRAIWSLEAARARFEPFDAPALVDASASNAGAARRVALVPGLRHASHVSLDVLVTVEGATAPGPWRRPAFARIRFVDTAGPGGEVQTGKPMFASAAPRAAATAAHGIGVLPAGTDALDVQLVALRGTGRVRFENVRVSLVRRRDGYRVAAVTLGALWLALGAALLRACLRRTGALPVTAGALALAVIVIGVAMSESVAVPGLTWLRAAGGGALPALSDATGFAVFKIGHFLAFALAGAVGAGLHHDVGATRAETLALLALTALASESLQRHLPDRSALLSDVGLDLAGAVLGFSLASLALAAVRTLARGRGPTLAVAPADVPSPPPGDPR